MFYFFPLKDQKKISPALIIFHLDYSVYEWNIYSEKMFTDSILMWKKWDITGGVGVLSLYAP